MSEREREKERGLRKDFVVADDKNGTRSRFFTVVYTPSNHLHSPTPTPQKREGEWWGVGGYKHAELYVE